MKTKTETLIKALRILERKVQAPDGVAGTVIGEAANRIEELQAELDSIRMRDCERDAAVIERLITECEGPHGGFYLRSKQWFQDYANKLRKQAKEAQ